MVGAGAHHKEAEYRYTGNILSISIGFEKNRHFPFLLAWIQCTRDFKT